MKLQSGDVALRSAVLEELEWNTLLDASQLNAEVNNRVVTLVGTVDSIAEKLTAQSAVESIDGVHDVLSRIDVKVREAAQRTDEEIARVVLDVLTWDALVPEQDIMVTVDDAWVTLAGAIPTRRQAEEAERAVSHLIGIRGITNDLELSDPPVTPEAVRHSIEQALARRATHRARKIDVIVDRGTVVLRGTVESLGQMNAVHHAVGHAPGVEVIRDELHMTEIPPVCRSRWLRGRGGLGWIVVLLPVVGSEVAERRVAAA
jgi:osmotically-inducible protein OsmY